jgi:hypothetical protein
MSDFNLASALSNPCKGEIEFIVKDKAGRIIESRREENIIKIFAKEILSHRATYSKVWDPTSNAWVDSGINIEDFAPKYIVFGASFDENFIATDTADTRFYQLDNLNNTLPIALSPGAAYQGGLINPIPVAEPDRPLKRIERVFFEPSYQPAGTPFLQDDVRAINNVVVYETVLRKDEYNGIGTSSYFTITEVALVGAPEIGTIGSCECDPRTIFLEGKDGMPLLTNLVYGSTTISLDSSVTGTDVDVIKEGDQIRLTIAEGTSQNLGFDGTAGDIAMQLNPYYLVVSKAEGGRDITLDRVPTDTDNIPLASGQYGVERDSFRIFSHRILKYPLKKSEDFEITIRWRIIFN